MEESIQEIISYYRDYLGNRIGKNIDKIHVGSIKDIKKYEDEVKYEFKILEKLSNKYKLYDENYNEFMISMGKFALCLDKLDESKIDYKNKEDIRKVFLNIHYLFEELEQRNIVKDVYVWKFISNKL